jgi:hypothetical protein
MHRFKEVHIKDVDLLGQSAAGEPGADDQDQAISIEKFGCLCWVKL